METHAIHESALKLRIVPQALDQVTAKVVAHFGDTQVKPQDLSDYLAALPAWRSLAWTK